MEENSEIQDSQPEAVQPEEQIVEGDAKPLHENPRFKEVVHEKNEFKSKYEAELARANKAEAELNRREQPQEDDELLSLFDTPEEKALIQKVEKYIFGKAARVQAQETEQAQRIREENEQIESQRNEEANTWVAEMQEKYGDDYSELEKFMADPDLANFKFDSYESIEKAFIKFGKPAQKPSRVSSPTNKSTAPVKKFKLDSRSSLLDNAMNAANQAVN